MPLWMDKPSGDRTSLLGDPQRHNLPCCLHPQASPDTSIHKASGSTADGLFRRLTAATFNYGICGVLQQIIGFLLIPVYKASSNSARPATSTLLTVKNRWIVVT